VKKEEKMNERIEKLAEQAKKHALDAMIKITDKEQALKVYSESYDTKFAELIVRECISKIETHQIPVGNSAAGEMACEWTYAALKEIRDEIREHFGVEN
jgi:pyrrolidone-carboxylate peptidase